MHHVQYTGFKDFCLNYGKQVRTDMKTSFWLKFLGRLKVQEIQPSLNFWSYLLATVAIQGFNCDFLSHILIYFWVNSSRLGSRWCHDQPEFIAKKYCEWKKSERARGIYIFSLGLLICSERCIKYCAINIKKTVK